MIDMKLNGDGTCPVVHNGLGAQPNATYRVIGKQVTITLPTGSMSSVSAGFRIVSVTESELVIERDKGDGGVRKTRYTRAK